MRLGELGVRRGMVLLEAIVALTILAVAGGTALTLAASSLAAIDRAAKTDQASQRASRFLDAVSLWPRADLDRHFGIRHEGSWLLDIGRPSSTLYVVSLSDSATGRVLFATSFFRPEVAHAAP
ncbi:MAG TPA: type II secretion system protein [Gemmatimonadaceae bacterium]|nr:type II secretion system protein [Gemmatimonadaceae bacterium]